MKIFIPILLFAIMAPFISNGQFAPPAGQPGSTAIYKDSSVFVSWANNCIVNRGWMNIADTSLGKADVGDNSMACGPAGTNGVVSLGDRGSAILTFVHPITNGPSWDFAVFENSFSDTFLELAFVEVSSDGMNYFRFPATSLTDTLTQVDTYDTLDATKINNLAGKYRMFYGTPFDLDELSGILGLDINHITHIRLIDVVGSINKDYASYDSYGHAINDPWPTPFNSSGFDLDAVGVIHQDLSSVNENQSKDPVSIFPNPCTDHIKVRSACPNGQITLMDMNGRKLTEIIPEGENMSIQMSNFSSGIYILKITQNNLSTFHKIIKN